MKKRITLKFIGMIGFICAAAVSASGQYLAADASEMEDLFYHKKFSATWFYYQQRLAADSMNAELNYKMGICYLNSRSQKEKALSCLEKALMAHTKNSTSLLTCKILADACYLTARYEQAMVHYEAYKKILLDSGSNFSVEIREIDKQIEICKLGKELKEMKELVSLMINAHFGEEEKIASSPDYSTTYSADETLVTCTFRRSFPAHALHDKEFFEEASDKNILQKKDTLRSFDTSAIDKEATVATSVDGQIVLTYRNDGGESNLYTSILNGNTWTVPEKLNKILNTRGWELNEFISADGTTLYFTSDRPGGYGGKDIYKSEKLPGGEWSRAVNMGYPVNSPYDDEAPFIHPDGVTLYFSSNRTKKKTFDLFMSALSDSGWSKPLDVGYPLNKTERERPQDVADKDKSKFAEKENCLVTFVSPKKIPLTLVRGKITGNDGRTPPYVEITVTDNETGEVAGVYHADKSGNYVFMLPPGKNNNVTYESAGYLFYSENMDISKTIDIYKLRKPIILEPLAEHSSLVLNNLFFKEDQVTIDPYSYLELEKVLKFLAAHPKMTLEVNTQLYFRKKERNVESILAREKNVHAVAEYFINKGIDKNRVRTRVYEKIVRSKKRKKETMPAGPDLAGKIAIKILELKN